jgi:hypothetical protein
MQVGFGKMSRIHASLVARFRGFGGPLRSWATIAASPPAIDPAQESMMTNNSFKFNIFAIFSLCTFGAGLGACSKPADTPEAVEAPQALDDRSAVDLVVAGDYVITMDRNDTVIADGAVAIDKGVIVATGRADDINAKYKGAASLPGSGRVVLPGLINGHSHAAMTLLRGVADDLALMDWLNNYIFPAEVEFVDAEFVRIGTELACWEMIRGGTTTFVDM